MSITQEILSLEEDLLAIKRLEKLARKKRKEYLRAGELPTAKTWGYVAKSLFTARHIIERVRD